MRIDLQDIFTEFFPVILCGIMFLAGIYSWANWSSATLRMCNFSPYNTQHIVASHGKNSKIDVYDYSYLKSGTCKDVQKWFWKDKPNFYVHTRIPKNWKNKYWLTTKLIVESNTNRPEITEVLPKITSALVTQFGKFEACVSKQSLIDKLPITAPKNCPNEKQSSHFQVSHLQSDGDHYFVWEHPFLPLTPVKGDLESSIRIAKQRAIDLNWAIFHQWQFDNLWSGKTRPFLIGGGEGGDIVDFNGPLKPGVGILKPHKKTIFGKEMPIKNGDIILSLNGHAVFGEKDFYYLLNKHGLSRDHGIRVPLKIKVLSGKVFKEVETTYFFNEHHASYEGDQTAIAFWYGVGDVISFGQTPWVMCNGSNFLRGAGNLLFAASERLLSWAQSRDFNSNVWKSIDYIDGKECTWQRNQASALAQQREEKIYLNSQWLGIFTPGAVRFAGAKAGRKLAARFVGRGRLAKGLADASLEVVETALWSVGTAAPGTPFAARLGDAATVAPWAAIAGFGSGALLSGKK